jgi:alpha-tubulin suppressor-like RCC1 family protein
MNGKNSYSFYSSIIGQLGVGNTANSPNPQFVNVLGQKCKKIAAGVSFSVALRVDGNAIYTWGSGFALGRNIAPVDSSTPVQVHTGVLAGKTVTNIVAGVYAVLALTQDGQIYTWGINTGFQLGNASQTYTALAPETVDVSALGPDANFTQIAMGKLGAFALAKNGTLYSWGQNYQQAIIQPDYVAQHYVPTAVNTSILDGPIHSIQANGDSGVIITQSKQVYTFGYGQYGTLGTGKRTLKSLIVRATMTAFDSTVVDVKINEMAAIGYTTSGTLYTWGYQGTLGVDSTTAFPPRVTLHNGVLQGKDVVNVQAGGGFTIALTSDGKVYSWGDNGYGCLGTGTTIEFSAIPVAVDTSGALAGIVVSDIAASSTIVAVLSDSGTMFMWGANNNGQLGIGSTIDMFAPQILNNASSPMTGKRIIKIAITEAASFALTQDNKLYSWGSQSNGLLGDGVPGFTYTTFPGLVNTTLLNGKIIVSIKAGGSSAALLTSDGLLFAWGDNLFGAAGTGSMDGSAVLIPTPVDTSGVLLNKNITSHCVGSANMGAIDANGTLYGWGWGNNGANGVGNTNNQFSPAAMVMTALAGYKPESITCGDNTMLLVASRGNEKAIFGWGNPSRQEIGEVGTVSVPVRVTAIPLFNARTVKISTSISGNTHSVVLTRNTTEYIPTPAPAPTPAPPTYPYDVYVMGYNLKGVVGDGTGSVIPQPFELSSRTVLAGKFISMVDVGFANVFVITNDNQIYGWVCTIKLFLQITGKKRRWPSWSRNLWWSRRFSSIQASTC